MEKHLKFNFLRKLKNHKKKNRKTIKKPLCFIFIIFIIIMTYYINFSKNLNNKKNIIPIAFSADNNYIYPLIVLLTSILFNSEKSTNYRFYIMIPYSFYSKNKRKILYLSRKYTNCKIKFYNLGKKYLNWSHKKHYSQTVYYRLLLPNLIKDLDKIIYLDCDTIVHKDLREFYNLKMKDKYYMGFPAHEISYLVINGTRNFINSGVILINLKQLRKINAPKMYEDYYKIHGTKKEDEYLINIIFYDKISFLPFKYGIPDFIKGHRVIGSPSLFWHKLKGYTNKSENEMISSAKDPTITHGSYTLTKWWNKKYNSLSEIGKNWLFYASKSNVFNEICDKYKQFKNICNKIKMSKQ